MGQRMSVALAAAALLWSSSGSAQLQELGPNDGQQFDNFGTSVALDTDTLVVGATFADPGTLVDAGAVYVFERPPGGAFAQVAKLVPPGLADYDWFGYDVAISGDTLVATATKAAVGANSSQGAAFVYARTAGRWSFVTRIEEPTSIGNLVDYGESVAVDGDTLVVGARLAGSPFGTGKAYVYYREEGGADNWGRIKVLGTDKYDSNAQFGDDVALEGDLLVVGAPSLDITGPKPYNEGAAYVFARDQGGPDNWGQLQRLQASDYGGHAAFGNAVALDGTTIAVGSIFKDVVGYSEGGGYLFTSLDGSAGSWSEQARWDGPSESFAYFGRSVALQGTTWLVGTTGVTGDTGAVYAYARDQGGAAAWGQTAVLLASTGQADDFFGTSVAIAGDTVAVGAWKAGTDDVGAVYVFATPSGPVAPAVPVPLWCVIGLALCLALAAHVLVRRGRALSCRS